MTSALGIGPQPRRVLTAKEALRQLDDAHDMWIEGVRGLGGAGLARPQGPTQPPEFADAPMARLILCTNVEVIHHGAEICLLRDLYLRKGSSQCGPPPLRGADGVVRLPASEALRDQEEQQRGRVNG